MQCLLIRQALQMIEEAVLLLCDGRILLVRTDHVLALPPQRVHRVQLRRPVRQPQQRHPFGRPQGSLRRVAGILIEQQRHMPTPVVPSNFLEERLEVAATPLLARQEQPGPGPQVHRPEDRAPRIATTQPHPGDFAALRPRGPQGREQQQVGLVLGQDHAPPRQSPDLPADPPFFFSRWRSGARS
jgi:hypothetical protein